VVAFLILVVLQQGLYLVLPQLEVVAFVVGLAGVVQIFVVSLLLHLVKNLHFLEFVIVIVE
jgi:hypothetical protein